MVRRLRVGVLGLLAGALICALLAAPALATPRLKHAWVVVLENHSVGQILGNSQAPYLNRLARRNGLATRYYSLSHPSLPNYLAMLSGSTQGCGSDSCKPGYGGPLLTRQLRHRGLAWRGYFQGLPHAGYVGGDHGSYVQHHNPFTYFNAIVHSHKARHNILPLSRFRRGLRHPAAFNLVVPDNQHNMHTGSIRESDRWLQHWIPQITHSRAFRRRSVIFITFDEGHNDSTWLLRQRRSRWPHGPDRSHIPPPPRQDPEAAQRLLAASHCRERLSASSDRPRQACTSAQRFLALDNDRNSLNGHALALCPVDLSAGGIGPSPVRSGVDRRRPQQRRTTGARSQPHRICVCCARS